MPVKVWRRPFEWAGDTKRHEFLNDAQAIFKVFSGIALGVALVFAFVFDSWQGALFFGAVALITSLLWITGTLLERGARQGLPGPVTEGEYARAEQAAEGAVDPQAEITEQRVARAGKRLAVGIVVTVVLTALAAAVFLFDRATLGIGFVLALVWGLFFGAPYWIAAVLDRQDDEREKGSR